MARSRLRLPLAVLAATLGLLLPVTSQAGLDDSWSDGFSHPGLGGDLPREALDLVVYDGALIVAGNFTRAEGGPGEYIARWDGTRWTDLGGGMNGMVRALYVYAGQLYAGGDFTAAGGGAADRIARWDGTTWTALGAGTNGSVCCITEFNGELLAGGSFTTAGGATARYIAQWDPGALSWSAVGSGMNAPVYSLATYQYFLYAGGDFTQAGESPASHLAIWTTYSWLAVGPGLNGRVRALDVYHGELIVGGDFSYAGTVYTSRLARWNGYSWGAFGIGVNSYYSTVYEVKVVGQELYVGGGFGSVDGVSAANIARWNGTSWNSLGGGFVYGDLMTPVPECKAIAGFSGQVVAAGLFYTAGGVFASSIASWDGSAWHAFMPGGGLDDEVTALVSTPGYLYAGGLFWMQTAWLLSMHRYGAWDGSSWQILGGETPAQPRAMTLWNGQLVSGTTRGTVNLRSGRTWVELGAAADGGIFSLVKWDSVLVAGGAFTRIGNVSASRIARWNGAAWDSLGTGISGPGTPAVNAAVVYQGRLIAGGSFDAAGGVPAANIAAWDGLSWQPIGPGVDGPVSSLTVFNGDLIVGGSFATAGGVPAANIASWDGAAWTSLGDGTNGRVAALAAHLGGLAAGGEFTEAGGSIASHIASWNGHDWAPLGSGTNGPVNALASSAAGLYAGGAFTEAGGKRSNFIALWRTALSGAAESSPVPARSLLSAAPNPFQETITLSSVLARSGPVKLTIHDIQGRLIAILCDGHESAGEHLWSWSGRSTAGVRAAAGVYFARLKAGSEAATLRLVKVR